MSKNIIAVPPYYRGTSFEDIVNSLSVAKKKVDCDIGFLGFAGEPLENTISSEDALDDSRFINGQWKLIKNIVKQRSCFKKVLFLDLFNPGIDLFRYAIEQDDKKIKMGSLVHGGSFVEDDLYDYSWLKHLEYSWFDINDVLYVPSHYLKEYCPEEFKEKTEIRAWGLDNFTPKTATERKWDVIFPHRLQKDKGVDTLIEIVQMCPGVEFLITTPQKKKFLLGNRYYKKLREIENVRFSYEVDNERLVDYLSQSKTVLSCALQEAFGYSIMKAVACGCVPVFPNQACYPEFFEKRHLYNNAKEASTLIQKALKEERNNYSAKEEVTKFSFVPLLQNFFE